jgi:hypothetical protein
MTFPALAVVLALGVPAQTPPSPAPTPTPPPVESPSADDEVGYPLGRLPMPDLATPGQPFRLVDLRYELRDQNGTDQSFAARLQVGRLGYLGLDFVGERRELTLETRRVRLAAVAEGDLYALATSVRAPWFILSTEATGYRASAGHGWVLHPGLDVRVTPDLELLGFVETDSARPNHRFLRAASLGVLWQRDSRLEVETAYTRRYEGTADGFEKTSDSGHLSLVAQLGRSLELSGDGLFQDTKSRFPYQQYGGSIGARAVLASRVLLEGGAESLFERNTGQRSHNYQGAISWHARRPPLPRGGEAAQRSLVLARRATAMGYNERRFSSDQERREQRMRLSLMAREEELSDDVVALYRAQVAEREVAVLGAEFVDTVDSLPGVSARTARLFVGVPWPPSWPWQRSPAAAPFLRLDLERKWETTAVDFDAVTSRVSLSAALNREMDLVVRWSDAQPSALEAIQGLGKRRTFELSYVYAFGR